MEILSQKFFYDGRTTTCVVDVRFSDGLEKTFVGNARRHSIDRPNRALGQQIAEARAFQKAVNRLNRRAQGAMRHQEFVIEQKSISVHQKPKVQVQLQPPRAQTAFSD